MSDSLREIRDETRKFAIGKLLEGSWAVITASAIPVVAGAVWAYFKSLPIWEVLMLAGPCLLASAILGMLAVIIYRQLFNQRAELRISFSPGEDYIFHDGYADARFIVRNVSTHYPAKRVFVKIESLLPIGLSGAHPQAAKFRLVEMWIERREQGLDLRPGEGVEVFGPQAAKGTGRFYFRSKEPAAGQDGYFTASDQRYRLLVVATADNADPARKSFLVFADKGGIMRFEEDGG